MSNTNNKKGKLLQKISRMNRNQRNSFNQIVESQQLYLPTTPCILTRLSIYLTTIRTF